jgi:hypothetical protein
LRGTPCRAQGPDLKVRAGRDGRYPDAVIDCGARVPDALFAQEPRAVLSLEPLEPAELLELVPLLNYSALQKHFLLPHR